MRIDIAKRRRVMERSQKLGHCICDPRKPCPCDVFRSDGICPCAGERPDPTDLSQVRLMQLVHNAGCASKIAPADLDAVLIRLPEVKDPRVLSGLAAADDAAIYQISKEVCLVQTVDVFTPCVDDPRLFGRICAANCLSDIFAMGGKPLTALSVLSFPSETLDGRIMYEMLAGAMEVFEESGVALVGGHSTKDEEIKLGFAITGTIDPEIASSLEKGKPGDLLVLTKPLGTGVLSFGRQIGRNYPMGFAASEKSMSALNQAAAEAMLEASASACTDITGFGLAGHLLRLARQCRVSARLFSDALPAMPDVLEALREGVIPGAVERNREYAGEDMLIEAGVEEASVNLIFDAQTSGGLLISIPPERHLDLTNALVKRNVSAFTIGRLETEGSHRIVLSSSDSAKGAALANSLQLRQDAITMNKEINPSTKTDNNACCCSSSPASESSTAAGSLKAYGGFMRATQATGILDEKMKELILFSLILLSKCEPCFDTHYGRAMELGITQSELDEAAWCAIMMGGAPVRMFYMDCLARRASNPSAQ